MSKSLTVNIKRLDPAACLPAYAYAHDAGMDLFVVRDTILEPGVMTKVATGIAMEIPQGYVGLIWDKSGLAATHGLKTLGGVIDSNYRGEIMVGMINLSTEPYALLAGNKVAQMLIQEVPMVELREVEELGTTTERGAGAFGSSGK
jgi:dUTP pyrophosphatase